jgi:DNA invertase Pin-like site-specific DNA recombinase
VLKHLLADIERAVGEAVVYKSDRRSSSLMDFAKLIDLFEANDVTFLR